MGHKSLLTVLVAASFGAFGGQLVAQGGGEEPLEARLWVGWEDEPLVRRGEQVRIQLWLSENAFTAVFRIDTDGRVALLSPVDPWDEGLRPGGREEELVLARSPYWTVADDPGVGYMFLVASPVPFDFSQFAFYPDFGWDLSSVATAVYDDPFLAMDDFIAAILPDWREVGYALDFVTYHVDEPRSYPRFLCYDCHTPRRFDQWNPYDAMCSSYRVVVYDDPYYYPAHRYIGGRVVYPAPIRNRPRYEVARRRSANAWAPIVRVRSAPPAQVSFKESPRTPTRTGSAARPAPRVETTGVSPRAASGRPEAESGAVRAPAARRGTSPGVRSGVPGSSGPPVLRGRGAPARGQPRPSGARSERLPSADRRETRSSAVPRATTGRTSADGRVPGARPSPSPSGQGVRPGSGTSARPAGDARRGRPAAGRGTSASPPARGGTSTARPGGRPGRG